jgi:hypothetical protein
MPAIFATAVGAPAIFATAVGTQAKKLIFVLAALSACLPTILHNYPSFFLFSLPVELLPWSLGVNGSPLFARI